MKVKVTGIYPTLGHTTVSIAVSPDEVEHLRIGNDAARELADAIVKRIDNFLGEDVKLTPAIPNEQNS